MRSVRVSLGADAVRVSVDVTKSQNLARIEESHRRALFLFVSVMLREDHITVTSVEEFQNGLVLIKLVERLTGERLSPKSYRPEPRNSFDMVLNNDEAIKLVTKHGVRVQGCSGHDIVSGNSKALLGLLTILFFKLHAQAPKAVAGRDPLLAWAQGELASSQIPVQNWRASWRDGRAFYNLVRACDPDSLPPDSPDSKPAERVRKALEVCEKLNVWIYAEVEDIASSEPNDAVLKMQVQELYNWVRARAGSGDLAAVKPVVPPVMPGVLPRGAPLPIDADSKLAVGIDFGAQKIRFGLFNADRQTPNLAVDVITSDVVFAGEKIVVNAKPEPGVADRALPSVKRLLGRHFDDPTLAVECERFPVPVVAHPETGLCVFDIDVGNGQHRFVSPEEIAAEQLKFVKEYVSKKAGKPVENAAITVPATFSYAQREALAAAAKSVGLRVASMEAEPVAAARALKATGDIPDDAGPVMIVDCGESKTEVTVLFNRQGEIRQMGSGGSPYVGGVEIRSLLHEELKDAGDAKAVKAGVSAFLEHPESGRIVVGSTTKSLSEEDVRRVCEPVVDCLGEAIIDALGQDIKPHQISTVKCIGGLSHLEPVQALIKARLPDATISFVSDPNTVIAPGAAFNAAQKMGKLDAAQAVREMECCPASVGVCIVGGGMLTLFERGQTLPARAHGKVAAAEEGQRIFTLRVYQGEHLLASKNQFIGELNLPELPPCRRQQEVVMVQGVMDLDQSVRIVATPLIEGAGDGCVVDEVFPLNPIWIAGTDEIDEDFEREELWIQEGQARMRLELKAADNLTHKELKEEFVQAREKWHKWYDEHLSDLMTGADWSQALYDMWKEFAEADSSSGFKIPDAPRPNLGFSPIYPLGPAYVTEGSVILRMYHFESAPVVDIGITDYEGGQEIKPSPEWHLLEKYTAVVPVVGSGTMLETFIRLRFERNGKYVVKAFIGTEQRSWFCRRWLVEVEGAPGAERSLAGLVPSRKWVPASHDLATCEIQPAPVIAQCGDEKYSLKVRYKGQRLTCSGRETSGERRAFLPRTHVSSAGDGWSVADVAYTLPGLGVWRLMFGVDGEVRGEQFVVAGPPPAPTPEEAMAFNED